MEDAYYCAFVVDRLKRFLMIFNNMCHLALPQFIRNLKNIIHIVENENIFLVTCHCW